MPSFDAQPSVSIIERERVTSVLGVGWMIRQIIGSKGDLSSVQSFGHGGAASAKELVSEVLDRNPNSTSSNGYGMTETNGPVCTSACRALSFASLTHFNYLLLLQVRQ